MFRFEQVTPKGAPFIRGALGLLALFVVLQVVSWAGWIGNGALPYPTAIVGAALRLLGDGAFWSDIWVTVRGATLGLILGTIFGVVLGSVIGMTKLGRWLLQPIVEVIRPLPGIAVAPLFVAMFQSGILSRSLTVALSCTWPILFNTQYGFRSINSVATLTARSFRESRFGILRRVNLPFASPFIFTGFRLSASLAIIVEIAVEILISNGTGVGGFIVRSSYAASDLATIYGATIIAGVMSLLVNFGLGYADERWFGWRKGLSA